ncbi:MAG: hypothetical protein NC453_15370, partial [Muribaculum sp.]|nr:hypothetical protein [Muribaculum sp.]
GRISGIGPIGLNPKLELCIVDDKLYLFGGVGNTVGKQEIPSKNYFDLWEYDTKTLKGRKLWEIDSISTDFLPSLSMYYVPRDSSFYVASTLHGGCMIKISKDSPSYTVVSEPLDLNFYSRDCMFNLYQGSDKKTYYLVVDKLHDDLTHEYAIYEIKYPFANALLYDNPAPHRNMSSHGIIWWLIGALLLLIATIYLFVVRKKRNAAKVTLVNHTVDVSSDEDNHSEDACEVVENTRMDTESSDTISDCGVEKTSSKSEDLTITPIPHYSTSHFNRSKSAISLLGHFEVRDKNGIDITPNISIRLRDILLMLILLSEKHDKGVYYKTLDEYLWPEKDEKSAKNNRGVYMRKLRLLLEEVGIATVSCEKGHYHISMDNICVDYNEAKSRLTNLSKNGSIDEDELEKVIELLLFGPLLPDIKESWIDQYKANYTELALNVLNELLHQTYRNSNDALAYRIAKVITLHDSLSEDAMSIKCLILIKQKMKGPAKKTYDIFCKEYLSSYGENYPKSFSQVIESAS